MNIHQTIYHPDDPSIFIEINPPYPRSTRQINTQYLEIYPENLTLTEFALALTKADKDNFEFHSLDSEANLIMLSREETAEEREIRIREGLKEHQIRDTMIAEAHQKNNERFAEKFNDPDYRAYTEMQKKLRLRGFKL